MLKRSVFFLGILLLSSLSPCLQASKSKETALCTPYERPPFVSEKSWKAVDPYLLPCDHPIKSSLDTIFAESRAVASHQALKKAGFTFHPPRGDNHLTAAKHPKLKGYLIKTFLDTQNLMGKEWKVWIHRIKGAQLIDESIQKHQFEHLLKVPKKWIYPLPAKPSPSPKAHRQNYILIVEDMHIYDYDQNKKHYQRSVNREMADALYLVISENLLIDSVYIDNIPFSKDGRIAFIDTEHYMTDIRPLKLHRLAKHFSPIMQQYWSKILENGGPVAEIPESWKFDKNKIKKR